MYGETFGNATEKYFMDYRSKTLNSSSYTAKNVRFEFRHTHNNIIIYLLETVLEK